MNVRQNYSRKVIIKKNAVPNDNFNCSSSSDEESQNEVQENLDHGDDYEEVKLYYLCILDNISS